MAKIYLYKRKSFSKHRNCCYDKENNLCFFHHCGSCLMPKYNVNYDCNGFVFIDENENKRKSF